jgi:hypothetical protein
MWRILIIVTLLAGTACSTQRGAVRVRCDRHLVPINVPAPPDHDSGRRSSFPPSGGENR